MDVPNYIGLYLVFPEMNKTLKNAIELGKKLEEDSKEEICIACNGTGYYDDDGSPPCGSCNGTGFIVKIFNDE